MVIRLRPCMALSAHPTLNRSLSPFITPSLPASVRMCFVGFFKRFLVVLVYFCARNMVAKHWRNTKIFRFSGGSGSPQAAEGAQGMDGPQPPTKRIDQMDIDQALLRGGVKVRCSHQLQRLWQSLTEQVVCQSFPAAFVFAWSRYLARTKAMYLVHIQR